ncbi:MAG: CopG family transcriptional regulator, partial [Oscillospiraceae bacterium]|nr:CopG family transcriptional regulator [Oscillospiraceae bacterium]
MEKRIAVIGIIIEEIDYAEYVNEILHEYNSIIIGRMGIPYREKGISVISLA